MPDSRYSVRDPKMEQVMRGIAERLDFAIKSAGSDMGFALFLFDMGKEDGNLFYICNGTREDVKAMLQEWIKRQEM